MDQIEWYRVSCDMGIRKDREHQRRSLEGTRETKVNTIASEGRWNVLRSKLKLEGDLTPYAVTSSLPA